MARNAMAKMAGGGARLLLMLLMLLMPVAAQAAEGQKLGGQFERYANEHAFALSVLEDLNDHSIRVNREYCGFIYYDATGQLAATKAEKGGSHSCLPIRPTGRVRVFASYHTHAGFATDSLNEYPSDQDMRGDFGSGHNGYVATPGGRLWFVDIDKRVSRQLCGYRCLPFDRRYRENPRERPKQSVNLMNLQSIIEGRFGDRDGE